VTTNLHAWQCQDFRTMHELVQTLVEEGVKRAVHASAEPAQQRLYEWLIERVGATAAMEINDFIDNYKTEVLDLASMLGFNLGVATVLGCALTNYEQALGVALDALPAGSADMVYNWIDWNKMQAVQP